MFSVPFHSIDHARQQARRRLPRLVFDYIDGAAGRECANQANLDALNAIKFCPRSLRNVEDRSLSQKFLGRDYSLPFGVAPMGMCNLAHPNADRALASLATSHGVPYGLSTAASSALEPMQVFAGNRAWFQLYVSSAREFAEELIDRAEAAGYETLVFTVDVPVVARRARDIRNGFKMPFRIGPRQFLDFALHPRWSFRTLARGAPKLMNAETSQLGKTFDREASRAGADRTYLKWLRERWKGKLIVKGVLSPDDAVTIKNAGADAVWVSNHGGRQLDSSTPAIHALPAVRDAVGADYPIIYDSGIRSGDDIVRARALGADLAMIGRPYLYAIAAFGPEGGRLLTEHLAQEVSAVMAQIGVRSIAEIDRSALAAPYNPKI